MASARAFALLGRKPANKKRSVGSPQIESAAMAALGPGAVLTDMPASLAARTSLYPGSEINGVPASETSHTAVCGFNQSGSITFAAMVVIAAHLLFKTEMMEQLSGHAAILNGNNICRRQ